MNTVCKNVYVLQSIDTNTMAVRNLISTIDISEILIEYAKILITRDTEHNCITRYAVGTFITEMLKDRDYSCNDIDAITRERISKDSKLKLMFSESDLILSLRSIIGERYDDIDGDTAENPDESWPVYHAIYHGSWEYSPSELQWP